MPTILCILCDAFFGIISLILGCPIRNRCLRIQGISLSRFALYDISYVGSVHGEEPSIFFTCSALSVSLHLPRTPNRRWFTLTLTDILYKSSSWDASSSRLTSTLWFFPILFRQSAGPWVHAQVDDFRIRVASSTAMPYAVQRLRETLVRAILRGKILRADDFKTNVAFVGITEHKDEALCTKDEDSDQTDEDTEESEPCKIGCDANPPTFASDEQDSIRISVGVDQLLVDNAEGRVLACGGVDAQLRRAWTGHRGSLVMIAREARWIRVPMPWEMECKQSWWSQLASSIAHFPYGLAYFISHPFAAVDVYIPRADVSYDLFRIRDAELVAQSIELVREKMVTSDFYWPDFFADMVANTALTMLQS